MKDATALLRELKPYLSSIVCYASTIDEHLPNRIVKDIEDLLARGPNVDGTAYTVMDGARAAESGKQVLITAEDIKMVLDRELKVGQIKSRQGDGSKPYAVFNKRDCSIKLAQIVNDRFNAKKETK